MANAMQTQQLLLLKCVKTIAHGTVYILVFFWFSTTSNAINWVCISYCFKTLYCTYVGAE
jgi:hypothetical protein